MKSLASTTGTYRSGWAEAAPRVAITQKSEEIARLHAAENSSARGRQAAAPGACRKSR